MAKDPYKILGVAKSADDKAISKAYRTLAKKYHPDLNPNNKAASEKFKEISAANALLSDKKLRQQYDTGQVDGSGNQRNPFAGRGGGRTSGFGGAGGMDGGDMADLFSSMFGMQMGGQTGHPHTRTRQRAQKGQDVRYQLEVGFGEAINGAIKHVRMASGNSLKISIPVGTEDGAVLRLRGKGSDGIGGGPAGDAKVTIKVGSHKYWKRDGDTLRLDLPISLKEAVIGAKIPLVTPRGSVQLKISAGSSSGKTLRLAQKGVKTSTKSNSANAYGDILVRLMIVLPDNLDAKLIKKIGALDDANDLRKKIAL